MRSMLAAGRAKLLELYFALNFLSIFPAPIIDGLALGTDEFY